MDLRISLQKLDVLDQVVRRKGVGKAAEVLFVAQPVVTAHIRSLEQRLGVKLFYRDGRQLNLTEHGRAIHAWAEDVLTRTRELDRYLSGLADGQRGTAVFGASMSVGSYLLPKTLTRFRAAHPEAEVTLSISDTEHIIEDTRLGLLDFAFVVSSPDLKMTGMVATAIAADEIVLVTLPDGEPEKDVISLEDIKSLPFVDAPDGIIRRTFIDSKLRELGVSDRTVVIAMGHPEAMKAAVLDGAGVCLLFRSAVSMELDERKLRQVIIEGASMELPIYLVHRKGKSFSPLQQRIIDEVRRSLGTAQEPSVCLPES